MDADLAFAGALEQRRLILAKEVSPRELAEWYLERIERLDAPLHSYLTVPPERALRAARAAEDAVMRGDRLGALHGVPVSIKDTEDTRGVRTTRGSLIFENHVPNADALPVERILGAGAIMLGKTSCPESDSSATPPTGWGSPAATPGIPSAARTDRPAAARRPGRPGCAPCLRATTVVVPCAVRQASAVSTASSRLWGGCRGTPAPASRRP